MLRVDAWMVYARTPAGVSCMLPVTTHLPTDACHDVGVKPANQQSITNHGAEHCLSLDHSFKMNPNYSSFITYWGWYVLGGRQPYVAFGMS